MRFQPRFEKIGRNWYAICSYSHVRWKVVGIVGQWPPAFTVERLR